MALYADDLLVSIENVLEYDKFKTSMRDGAQFKIKDIEKASALSKIQFDTVGYGYEIHQRSYIEDILERYIKEATLRTYLRDTKISYFQNDNRRK